MTQPDTCNNVFEKIYAGEIKDRVTFLSKTHGVFAVLALHQAARGHTLIVPEACHPTVDELPWDVYKKIALVSRATGLWLQAAFQPKGKVSQLVSGNEVRHAHVHRIPSTGRDWLQVLGHEDPRPFLQMSNNDLAEVYAKANFHPDFATAVEAQLGGDYASYEELAEMAYDLAA